jgi:aspartyl-tRNA(Asn)/glutamyl-tRNA(Gln) amidotransferase subunit A
VNRRTAIEIRDAILDGRSTPAEVTSAALERAAAIGHLNAFITLAAERATARAETLRPQPSEVRPLLGVPIAVKDNICVRGMRTTAGSRLLEHYVPPYDATVIERLEAAGAVIVGKTNCDEFAMGSSTEHSAFGPARNPWDVTRIAGGSSGGSAIAVAGGVAPLALGSETGGSVRQPAALCGVIGLKPTYGRISRYGLLAFASSVDQVGIFGTTAADVGVCLEVIAGPDPRDPTSSTRPAHGYEDAVAGEARGLRIGVPTHLLTEGLEPGVRAAFDDSLEVLRAEGAVISEIELPHGRFATASYALIAMAEASSNLSRYDGARYGTRAPAEDLAGMYGRTRALFGLEVKRRIMLGTFVLSAGYYDAYYRRALQVAAEIRDDYIRAFTAVDVVATPTSPTTAFRIGEKVEDPLAMYLADVFTASANLARLPAISVPCGLAGGLPAGLQFTAADWGESTLLRLAGAFERATPWSRMAPAGPGEPPARPPRR